MEESVKMGVPEQIQVRDKLYIGGEWVDPSGDETLDVINSTTEEVIGRIPQGTPEDVDRAVAAARAAFEPWSQRPASERGELLAAIGAALGARQDEIASLITAELGMPLALSKMIQAGLPSLSFNAMPPLVAELRLDEQIGNSLVVREPIGVGGAITPWNYPLQQIPDNAAPAPAAA